MLLLLPFGVAPVKLKEGAPPVAGGVAGVELANVKDPVGAAALPLPPNINGPEELFGSLPLAPKLKFMPAPEEAPFEDVKGLATLGPAVKLKDGASGSDVLFWLDPPNMFPDPLKMVLVDCEDPEVSNMLEDSAGAGFFSPPNTDAV